jgi:hypothetical protein
MWANVKKSTTRRRAGALPTLLLATSAAGVLAPRPASAATHEQGHHEVTLIVGFSLHREHFALGAGWAYYVLDGLAPGVRVLGEIGDPFIGELAATLKYLPVTDADWVVLPFVTAGAGGVLVGRVGGGLVEAGAGLAIPLGSAATLDFGVNGIWYLLPGEVRQFVLPLVRLGLFF